MARRPWQTARSFLGAFRTILACILLTTCAPESTAPGGRMVGQLDLSSLLRAPGDLPIPIDEVVVETRRVEDSVIVDGPRSITIDPERQSDTALRVEFNVVMEREVQEFYVKVSAYADGVLYFVVEETVTARRNRSVTTPPLVPLYVGPGANADELQLDLEEDEVAAGDSILATGLAFGDEAPLPGTPIGFISSQPTLLRVQQVGLSQAWLIASPTAPSTEVTITLVGPNNLSADFPIAVVGGAPTGVHFVALSATTQNGTVNQLAASVPRVRLVDGQDAPIANATVTFVTVAGGVITDSVVTTNGEGEAALGSWRLGTLAGSYAVQATASGATALQFNAQAAPTTVASLVKIAGDAQTANTNTALTQPLVIEARDTFANPLAAGPTVTWTATDGTITPSSTLNAQGQAQANWTLGSTQAAPTATATLSGVTTIFTATTTFPNPTIQLAFTGIPGVGVGLTSQVRVSLTTPAPAGGIVVNLSSASPTTFTVPGEVTIAAGQTSENVLVTGVAVGTALLSGSAEGYITGTLSVDVQLRNLNPPVTISVPYGQTASLPISIPSPAPAGGITIAVASSNPTQVGVATPTVTIPAGGTSTSATLQGLLPGTSTITVSNPAYNSGTSTATTAAALRISSTTIGINASFGQAVEVEFVSNSLPIAAPAPGVSITYDIATPACVAVTPSPATIATGLTSTTVTFSYAGSAPAPCSSRVILNAANIQPDTVNVSVAAVPVINAPDPTVGLGLMTPSTPFLGATNHGGVTLSIVSLNPAVAQPATSGLVAPADSVGFLVPNGSNSVSYVVHGITLGTATFVAKAPGFVTDTFTVQVVTPGIDIQQLSASTTTFSPNDEFFARTGIPNTNNTGLQQVQAVRFGQPPVTVTFTSGTPATGVLRTQTVPSAPSVTADIAVGGSNTPSSLAAGGVEFDPIAAGTTTVTASAPGFTAMTSASVLVTVSAPAITGPAATVGAGLVSGTQTGFLGATNHGGTTVWVKSVNPTLATVSPNAITAGTDSIGINLLNGANSFSYVVHGMGGQGVADVVLSADGFVPDTVQATVQVPVYDIQGLTMTHTDLGGNDPFTVRVGIGTAGGMSLLQAVRPGGTPFVATLTNTTAAVADLVTQALTADAVTVVIPVGASSSGSTVANGGVEFDPVAGGTTTVTANIPGLVATTAATVNITVTSTPISIGTHTVGAGLMTSGNGSLGGNGQHGGVTVVVKSLNPAVMQVAPNLTTASGDSIILPLANGVQNFQYVVHGVDGVNDSTQLVAYAPGFSPDTTLIRVPQPALDVSGINANQQTVGNNDVFSVRIGVPSAGNGSLSLAQARRFGGAPLVATITNSNAAIADLVTLAGASDQVTVNIEAGNATSPATVATGGVEFDPIGPGTTNVSATIPGYIATAAATQSTTISAPGISFNGVTVGAGLMQAASGNLGSGTHPTDSITLTSSQPSVLLLAPNATTLPTASIKVQITSGTTGFSFFMVGVEGQTGSVLVTGQFPGFTDGTATGDVRLPGIEISGLGTSTTATGADDAFVVRVGWPQANNTSIGQAQAIRFGGTAITAAITSSNQAVGAVKTSADSGASVTVTIPVGQSTSAASVAAGGVAFDPLSAGSTMVAVTAPGYIQQTNGAVNVTVATPTITLTSQTVGGGLMTSTQFGSLSGPVPAGGATLTLTSANPSIVLVAPDLTTTGTGSINIPLAAGATSFNYVVAAPFGATGTANITATMTGFTGDTKLVTVVQPAFEITSLNSSTTVGAANDEFAIRPGIPNALNTGLQSVQQVRWGGTQLEVTVTNSSAAVAQLVTTAGTGQSRTVPIFVGANTSPTTVAAGGVSFDGLSAGTTTVSATIPGFLTLPSASQSVTVGP